VETGLGGEHELAATALALAGGFIARLGHGVGHGVRLEIFHAPDCTARKHRRVPGAGLATGVAG
jgi:hypothetical protein